MRDEAEEAEEAFRYPIRGIFVGCWASAGKRGTRRMAQRAKNTATRRLRAKSNAFNDIAKLFPHDFSEYSSGLPALSSPLLLFYDPVSGIVRPICLARQAATS